MMILDVLTYTYDGNRLTRLGTDEYTAFMPVYLQGAANTLTDDDDREVLRRRYCGNFIYEDGILQRVLVDGGFITFSNGTPQYHFYIKDHLGSNRVVTDANGNIEEYNHYYPYGALMNISSASTQPYKYNGKELNRLNRLLWYDQSARQYNPILGRFMSMDPLCEKYYSISPYAFCANNPMRYVDPTGEYIAIFDNDIEYKYNYDQKVFQDSNGNAYSGNNEFISNVTSWLKDLSRGSVGGALVKDLCDMKDSEGNELGTLIRPGDNCRQTTVNRTNKITDSNIKSIIEIKKGEVTVGSNDVINLGHEMAHSSDNLHNTMNDIAWGTQTWAEAYAMHIENLIRVEQSIYSERPFEIREYYTPETLSMCGVKKTMTTYQSLFFTTTTIGNNLDRNSPYKKIKNGTVYKQY